MRKCAQGNAKSFAMPYKPFSLAKDAMSTKCPTLRNRCCTQHRFNDVKIIVKPESRVFANMASLQRLERSSKIAMN